MMRGKHVGLDELAGRLDRRAAQPLHAQLRDLLYQQIHDHALVPGDALPTEEELQRRFAVSRSVVRQALAGLAAEGVIQRKRGRGSVVATPAGLRRTVHRAGGLGEQAAARGQKLRTHVLSIETAEPPPVAQEALGTAHTWRIERLRCIDDTPVVFMRTFVPRDLFPHFTADLLNGASLLTLMSDAGHAPVGGPRQVQAVAATADLAAALEVEPGDPLLLLEGVTQDKTGRGLERFSAWHRANTVFDVDARVDRALPALPADELRRLRSMARQIEETLAGFEDRTAPPG
jgi:GntR family transcriptional regulator